MENPMLRVREKKERIYREEGSFQTRAARATKLIAKREAKEEEAACDDAGGSAALGLIASEEDGPS